MRSNCIKEGIARTPHRGLLMATGVSKKNMDVPFIGIASSFTDLVPGHIGMRDLERQIEKGIHSGGGQAFIFGVPAVCDGISMGHSGMRYSLPSRDLIADCVETMAEAHQLDGLVLLSNCDKITPGMLIAALRLNIPTIIVTAGPMLDGESHCEKLTMIKGSFEAVGKFRSGVIDKDRLLFTIPANTRVPINLKIWLEGGDIDCTNALASTYLNVLFKFGSANELLPAPTLTLNNNGTINGIDTTMEWSYTNDENSVWTKVTDVNQVFTQSVYIRVAEVVDVSPESYATFIEIK